MEIEILTTKKKLSKSLINQFPHADQHDLHMALLNPNRIFGFVMLNNEKFAIMQGVRDYKKLSIEHNWKASISNEFECYSSNRYKIFENKEHRDLFLEQYHQIVKIALDNHIYL